MIIHLKCSTIVFHCMQASQEQSTRNKKCTMAVELKR